MSVIFIMFERYIRESYVIILYYIIMFSKTRKSPTPLKYFSSQTWKMKIVFRHFLRSQQTAYIVYVFVTSSAWCTCTYNMISFRHLKKFFIIFHSPSQAIATAFILSATMCCVRGMCWSAGWDAHLSASLLETCVENHFKILLAESREAFTDWQLVRIKTDLMCVTNLTSSYYDKKILKTRNFNEQTVRTNIPK